MCLLDLVVDAQDCAGSTSESIPMQDQADQPLDYVELTSDVVAAYVSHNRISPTELADLIASVHRSLAGLGTPAAPEPEKLEPRIPIRKTITPDHLISLEDGKKYRSLKRHLTGRGLTPEMYRAKWGLPHDYPMIAPSYSKQRSDLARQLGLGQLRGKQNKDAPAAAEAPEPTQEAAPKRRRSTKPKE